MILSDSLRAELHSAAPLLVTAAALLATYVWVKRIAATSRCPFAGATGTGSTQRRSKALGTTTHQPAAAAAAANSPAAGGCDSGGMTEGTLRLSRAELAAHDGRDASKPLLIAVRGKIYDVSAGRSFYGPGGPYAVFAGRECARALAFMKVTAEDCSNDLAGATEAQLATLADWEAKFRAKYGVAGRLTD